MGGTGMISVGEWFCFAEKSTESSSCPGLSLSSSLLPSPVPGIASTPAAAMSCAKNSKFVYDKLYLELRGACLNGEVENFDHASYRTSPARAIAHKRRGADPSGEQEMPVI